jgi:hypothetical protein
MPQKQLNISFFKKDKQEFHDVEKKRFSSTIDAHHLKEVALNEKLFVKKVYEFYADLNYFKLVRW